MEEYRLSKNNDGDNFIIRNISISLEDKKRGNKFNTEFEIDVVSHNYCGKSLFIVDFNDIYIFAECLYKLNKTLSGTALIKDLSLGSQVIFSINRLGRISIEGDLYSEHKEQLLKFNFDIDQTYINDIANNLYRDLTEWHNKIHKC